MSELEHEQTAAEKRLDRQVLARLFALLRPHRGRLSIVLSCEIIMVLTIAIRPWFFGQVLDNGFDLGLGGAVLDVDFSVVGWMATGLACTWLLRFGCEAVSSVNAGNLAITLMADLRQRIADHVHRLSVGYFDRTRVGRVVARADRDVESLEPLLVYGLPQIAATSLRFVTACVLLSLLAPTLMVWLLLVIPLLAMAMWLFKRVGTSLWGRIAESKGRVTAHLVESIQGVAVLQQSVAEQRNRQRYAEELYELDRRVIGGGFGWAWFPPFTFVLFTGGLAMVLWQGGTQVATGALTIGQLTQCLFYVFLFLGPLMEIGDLFERSTTAGAAAQRIFLLLDTPSTVRDREDAITLDSVSGELVLDDVHFSYRSDTPSVFAGLSLTIPAGQTCAVVGPTGHGKSTLAQLLGRFYDVNEGAVRLDQRDIRTVTQASLRRHVAIVPQDNVLFSGTILDNLRVANPDSTDEQLIAACQELGADHVLERLPAGYATAVGSEGSGLSHGCRQLVCLVRAYVANPAVLILDEATSAIDLFTERRLQLALQRLVRGRTAVIIAHRLNTIRDADRILVMQDGQIVEDGPHERLMDAKGKYFDLYSAYSDIG